MVHQGIFFAQGFKAAGILVPVLLVDRNIVRALDWVLQGSFHLFNCCLELLPLHLHLQEYHDEKNHNFSIQHFSSKIVIQVPPLPYQVKPNSIDLTKIEYKDKQGNNEKIVLIW